MRGAIEEHERVARELGCTCRRPRLAQVRRKSGTYFDGTTQRDEYADERTSFVKHSVVARLPGAARSVDVERIGPWSPTMR